MMTPLEEQRIEALEKRCNDLMECVEKLATALETLGRTVQIIGDALPRPRGVTVWPPPR